jgi:hypothetical protein
MIATQNHKNNTTMSLSSEELKEVKSMSRKLRQLKRKMFLKQVEAPMPVDSFRSFIMGLAVEQEAKESYQSRSNSLSFERTSLRLSSFDNTASSFNDSISSIGDLRRIEE